MRQQVPGVRALIWEILSLQIQFYDLYLIKIIIYCTIYDFSKIMFWDFQKPEKPYTYYFLQAADFMNLYEM